jgi:hypothetical protein
MNWPGPGLLLLLLVRKVNRFSLLAAYSARKRGWLGISLNSPSLSRGIIVRADGA